MAAPLRVLIADPHAEFRRFLVRFVRTRLGARVVAQVENLERCLEEVRARAPDVVLIAIAGYGRGATDAIQRIRASRSGVRVIALSLYEDAPLADALLGAGAAGFVVKDQIVDMLPALLRGARRPGRSPRTSR